MVANDYQRQYKGTTGEVLHREKMVGRWKWDLALLSPALLTAAITAPMMAASGEREGARSAAAIVSARLRLDGWRGLAEVAPNRAAQRVEHERAVLAADVHAVEAWSMLRSHHAAFRMSAV